MSIGLDRRIAVGGAEHKGRGDPNLDVRQIEVAGFVQTDWRINRRFTVFAGLRYQWQTNISDNDNFALIDAVDVDISRVTADGAYDTIAIYEAAAVCGATVVIPPTKTAAVSRRRPRSTVAIARS